MQAVPEKSDETLTLYLPSWKVLFICVAWMQFKIKSALKQTQFPGPTFIDEKVWKVLWTNIFRSILH